ncbi:MAG: hypothetical protein M3Q65_16960 [Chloroflexota bacterium]|nr:hypothetical protein [Chloroflexota bacterium]
MDERALVRGIGWASLAMGLTILAPARAARLFGLGARPALMRAIGARDLVIGLGLLRRGDSAPWLRLQALADATDAALVGAGLLTSTFARGRAALWLIAALVSAWCSLSLARRMDGRAGAAPRAGRG